MCPKALSEILHLFWITLHGSEKYSCNKEENDLHSCSIYYLIKIFIFDLFLAVQFMFNSLCTKFVTDAPPVGMIHLLRLALWLSRTLSYSLYQQELYFHHRGTASLPYTCEEKQVSCLIGLAVGRVKK